MKQKKDRIPLQQKIKLKLREIPALLRAKIQERKHIPTLQELKEEEKLFEKEALSMKPFILKKRKKKK